jgi:hypothetical protein
LQKGRDIAAFEKKMNDFTDKETADRRSRINQHATYIAFVILILIRRVSIE